jgi:RNA polymerase sigma-70 factor (ECF subfamily)
VPDGRLQSSQDRAGEWGPVVDRALAGDRSAYARLARLVTGHLAHWRAYDFRPDWDDMVQDVLVSVVGAYREGRLDAPGALPAYVRQATRFKFIDRIRAARRQAPDTDPVAVSDNPGPAAAPWPPASSIGAEATELRLLLARAVEALPERERLAVLEVHVRGRTYDEAAEATGIPLGSLKRALRTGLARLREVLDDDRAA